MAERHPMEDEFTEKEMRLTGTYARALTGGPTDFDREVREHLDQLEKGGRKENHPCKRA